MSELKNSTYWKKNGVVVEANSFVEDEQFRKDGWIKSNRGGYEWYKRSLAKQPPAAELTAANDNRDTGWPQRDLDELGFSAMELPPAAETGARGDVSDWGIHPTQRELEAYGDGYAAGMLDGPNYAPLMNEIAALREQLAAAQAALKPFANQWAEWIKAENEWVHDPDTAMDIVEFFADYADNDVVAKHLKAAYDVLQATEA